jgi:glycosyltransferase involved in cell wall biosynthesis
VSRRELRILQVTAPGPVGGLESVVAALSLGLTRRGHRVTVSAAVETAAGPHPFLDMLDAGGVRVVHARGGYRAEAAALRRLARESGADVVHSHGYRSDVLARLAGRRGRLPLVATVHGFTGGGVKNRFYERLQRLALRGFDAVVPVSAALARQLEQQGVLARRLHLVPNAYAALTPPCSRAVSREKLGLPPHGPVIGWVGRLSREKGPDVALRALASLAGREWLAVFLGDGPERLALERLASECGIASRVRWMGNFAGAGAVMAAFDILLSSSRTEGTPVVLLEAAAAGVPIVATAVGGVPELLRETGGASPAPPDDPAALAAQLAWLLDHPEEAVRLGMAERDRLATPARFEAWLDRYEDIYRGVLARKGVA